MDLLFLFLLRAKPFITYPFPEGTDKHQRRFEERVSDGTRGGTGVSSSSSMPPPPISMTGSPW